MRHLLNKRHLAGFFHGYRNLRLLGEIPWFAFRWLRGNGLTRAPMVVTLELTYACNFQCHYCYLREFESSEDHLSLDDIRRLTRELDPKQTAFHLTGGEPFVREDLGDIVREIKSRGFYCALATNGSLLSDKTAEWLRDAGPDHISLSWNEEAGDWLEANLPAVRFLEEIGWTDRLSVNTVMHSDTLGKLPALVETLAGAGIGVFSFQHIMPPLEWYRGEEPREEIASMTARLFGNAPQEDILRTVSALRRIARRKKVRLRFIPELSPRETGLWYAAGYRRRCFYPYFSARVSPEGNIYGCPRFLTPLGNVRRDRLTSVWKDKAYREFRSRIRENSGFRECINCCKI